MDAVGRGARVLVIGLDPHRVPGPWDPAPVAEAIRVGLARFERHGVDVAACLVGLDGDPGDAISEVDSALQAGPWGCVVIGGGLRDPEAPGGLFEQVINLVHRRAPGAAIAFNTTPADTFDAAARWLKLP